MSMLGSKLIHVSKRVPQQQYGIFSAADTMLSHYHMVNFLQNTHGRHQSHNWGGGY